MCCLACAACDMSRPAPKAYAQRYTADQKAKLEATIDLPGAAAHILIVPTGYGESARCVVVTGAAGSSPAVSCTQPNLDLGTE